MDSTLLESAPAETGDGSISAAACAPWTTLVIEYTTALVRRAWSFFRGSNMKATEIKKLLKSHGIDTKFVRATCTAGCRQPTDAELATMSPNSQTQIDEEMRFWSEP
jgi:hypothetical protein